MPHGGEPRAGEDLFPSDEIKVFKEEGDEDEHQSSENLTEVKTSLVTEGEEEKSSNVPGPSEYGSPPKNSSDVCRPDSASHTGKSFDHIPPHSAGPIPYLVSSYHPHNGSLGPMPMAGKVPMVPPHSGSPLPFMVNIHGEPFPPQPPPAHMGIPPVTIDPKTGIPSRTMYIGPPAQYPPVFTPDFTHQIQWHPPSLYPTTSAGFRSAYSSALPVTSANLPRFSPPTILTHYPGISHPALITSGPKQELSLHHTNHRSLPEYSEQKYSPKSLVPTSTHNNNNNDMTNNNGERKTHIKKPLNAFMLYMKEMRAKVVAECTLKESAAINQILGRKWHGLSRDEQAKYYEMARKERQLHMQKYPGWSARDNYALQVKKKKRKRDRTQDGDGNNLKKCRARFGLDQQNSWCKPCRRKKKCIRYLDGADNSLESEDNLGSAGSVEAPTPDSNKTEDTDSQDLDTIQNNNSPLSPCTDEMDTKPRLDSNGMLRPQSPLQQHLYHHPYSVRQLIQPHHFDSHHHHHHRASPMKTSLITRTDPMSRFQSPSEVSTASQQPPPPPMLTVT
ncbi:transcription factor 7-like 2 isoform X2 [Parasteatoda tepidariorum]|uniref:transcription factor 7-like 2 isoform X2 n=1 Tax=Parasteatoda tepidariorum TaxID=114398 RepID=UPI000A2C08C4|nr:protein pangolin, isoforms A/H/I/S isoform X2 [Parasteatoda tepidariorum]